MDTKEVATAPALAAIKEPISPRRFTSIHQVINATKKAIGPVGKGGEFKGVTKNGDSYRYDYRSDEELTNKVSDAIEETGLTMLPVKSSYTEDFKPGGTRYNLHVTWELGHEDTEPKTVEITSHADSTSDKADGAAWTYNRKHLYATVFHIRFPETEEPDATRPDITTPRVNNVLHQAHRLFDLATTEEPHNAPKHLAALGALAIANKQLADTTITMRPYWDDSIEESQVTLGRYLDALTYQLEQRTTKP